MELDNFELEVYNDLSIDHKSTLIEIANDPQSSKFLGDLQFHFAMIKRRNEDNNINQVYIAKYNEEPVGFIAITIIENAYEISYGLLPKYRGYHLGALLLQEFSEKVFELYPEVSTLTLVINDYNTGSKKTAELAGYNKVSRSKYTQHRV